MSPGLCSVLQSAVERANELSANPTKRREFMCRFDSEFASATTEARYQNLFRKIVTWLQNIPNLDMPQRVEELRMAELAGAGILVIIKLHCAEVQPSFEDLLDQIEDAFSARLMAAQTKASKPPSEDIPSHILKERPGSLASILKEAGKKAAAISAQIEESLVDAERRDAESQLDVTSANVVPAEQVTLPEDYAIDLDDNEFFTDINDLLEDDGFGAPLSIPQVVVTSPPEKSTVFETSSGFDIYANEATLHVDVTQLLETKVVVGEQHPPADSFVLEPLDTRPVPPSRQPRKRIVSDATTKLTTLDLQRQIQDTSDIVRSLPDDRAAVIRNIRGWKTAAELLHHGSNVPRKGSTLQNEVLEAMNLPKRVQPTPAKQAPMGDEGTMQTDHEDDLGQSSLVVPGESMRQDETNIPPTDAPRETLESSSLPQASRIDTPSFEPLSATREGSVPTIFEGFQEKTASDAALAGTPPDATMQIFVTDIPPTERSSDEETVIIRSEETERSIDEAMRIRNSQDLITRAIRCNGERYTNPRNGKVVPYIAFSDIPKTGLCNEDHLPTLMSDLMVLIKLGIFICIQQETANESNDLYIFLRKKQLE